MSRSYCEMAINHPVHAVYHNTEYGFSTSDERVLFERLGLEIMQAGLSWEIVLKKREALNRAFDGFIPDKVAVYGDADVKRLLADSSIIRNRLKIRAIVENAGIVIGMRKSHEGFAKWLAVHHPMEKSDWVRLFKKTFKFTGGEITGEFLMSTGFLPGAHWEGCPVYRRLMAARSE